MAVLFDGVTPDIVAISQLVDEEMNDFYLHMLFRQREVIGLPVPDKPWTLEAVRTWVRGEIGRQMAERWRSGIGPSVVESAETKVGGDGGDGGDGGGDEAESSSAMMEVIADDDGDDVVEQEQEEEVQEESTVNDCVTKS